MSGGDLRVPPGGLVRFGHWVLVASAMALAYFAAARLGLSLISDEGVAVFWPASGLAAGALILLGGRWQIPICCGVLAGTFAANLLGGRPLAVAAGFGICNAGEAMVFAAVLRSRFGVDFRFDSLRGTIWFFLAAATSTAVAAIFAATIIVLADATGAGFGEIWEEWWLSDAIGIIAIAPVLIMLKTLGDHLLSSSDIAEGAAALAVIALAAGPIGSSSPVQGAWWVPVPIATIFPILLWMGARCRPVFLGAGLMIAALLIVIATTNSVGHFGNPRVPIALRIEAARITLVSLSFCALLLASVFAQRLKVETALRANEERFNKLTAASPGVILSLRVDPAGGITLPYVSPGISAMTGMAAVERPLDLEHFLAEVSAEDRSLISAAIAKPHNDLQPLRSEFRYRHPRRGELWLELHLAPVQEPDGAVIWHGFLQDITLRKTLSAHNELLMAEVNHRSKNLLSVVQAVAFHTARDEEPAQFVASFNRRLDALIATQSLVTKGGPAGITLPNLVMSQLGHFSNLSGSRILLEGESVRLTPEAAQAIGMTLHELATNSGKYGALTDAAGRVFINWHCDERFNMSWREVGGPPAVQPDRQGFGNRVIVEMCRHQLEATVALQYLPSGLVWTLSAPLARVVDG